MFDGMIGGMLEVIGLMTVVFFVVWGVSVLWDEFKSRNKNNNTEKDYDNDVPPYSVEEDLADFKQSIWDYMNDLETRLDILEEDINSALATKVSKKKSR